MLLPVILAYSLILYNLGLSALGDVTETNRDVLPNKNGQLDPPISLNDVNIALSEIQRKLQTTLKIQEYLMRKVNIQGKDEHENTNRRRMRRDAAEDVQPIPNLQGSEECVPGTIGCPITVTPYSAGGSCILCPAGPRGYPGQPGPPGRDGRDGRDSIAFLPSSDNFGGFQGSQEPAMTNTSGSVYVRWGHRACPSYSTLIYSGSAVGSGWSATGNGANQLCLPEEPEYNNPVAGVGGARAFLYSIEYQIDSYSTLESRQHLDVACAVCKAPSRYGQMMIPGRNTCPTDDWTLEYGGYLMAERNHANHKRSMFICVDAEMQSLERTHGYTSGGRLNLVEGRCSSSGGGLPCGPYIDGYEITCAVCTQ